MTRRRISGSDSWNEALETFLIALANLDWQQGHVSFRTVLKIGDSLRRGPIGPVARKRLMTTAEPERSVVNG